LLDEPTSALDPISSRAVEDSLVDLRDKYSLIIVTHNMQQAARISQRTAFFMDGNLIEVDQTRKIFTDPVKKETQDYVSGRFG
jgi:phosphate transport system ATP-binding protein